MGAKPTGDDGLNPALFANLETRRKRRESSQRGDYTITESGDMPTSQEEPSGQPKPGQALKSGAKRKFSAREDGERMDGANAPEGGDFQYIRNPIAARPDVTDRTKVAPSQPETQTETRVSEGIAGNKDRSRDKPTVNSSSALTGRSVLAPSTLFEYWYERVLLTALTESVNTDPVSSPVKSRRPLEGEKPVPANRDLSSKPRERSKSREQAPSQRFARPAKMSHTPAPDPKPISRKAAPPSRPPPETPAPPMLDVLSPDGSEPPAARPESRDTPPPGDLDPEAANTNSFGSLGRASRRQRGSVSYAEPNLRDKMRRPTKDLVDAVAAEDRLQQKKMVKAEAEDGSTEALIVGEGPSKMRTVVVKKEPIDEDVPDWKSLPVKGVESDQDSLRAEAPSPLGNKAPTVKANLPASVVTERRRRPSTIDRERDDGESGPQASGAGSANAALMADNVKTTWRDNSTRPAEPRNDAKPAGTTDIYEVPESSPAEANLTAAGVKESKPAIIRTTRRHSSIADDRVKDALARRAERRKEVANVAKQASKNTGGSDLKNSRSSANLAVELGEGTVGRGERAASRRRSMML